MFKWFLSFTSNENFINAFLSFSSETLTFFMFDPVDAITLDMFAKTPGLSSAITFIFVKYFIFSFCFHITFTNLSGSVFSTILTFLHSLLCIAIPFPFVITPIISSPGIGLQHFAIKLRTLFIPSTSINISFFFSCVSDFSKNCPCFSSLNRLTIFKGDIFPSPTAIKRSSNFYSCILIVSFVYLLLLKKLFLD